MRLTIIGSGTAAPEMDRVCSGYLLETGALRILLDCGPGVVHSMARRNLRWQDVTHLLITHFHNDHIGDIPFLFFAWKHGMRPTRREPLTVIGPAGTGKLLERMAGAFGAHVTEPGFDVHIDEVEPHDERQLSDVARLAVAKTPHTDNSVAYRLAADGRSFCYTGDTGMSADVAKFALNVDLLLIECSLPDDEGMDSHLTPVQVASMARIALPRRLVLTHSYPQLDRNALPGLVRLGGWPARVDVAADGDRVEV